MAAAQDKHGSHREEHKSEANGKTVRKWRQGRANEKVYSAPILALAEKGMASSTEN